jgi:hypothetical protein
MGRLAFGTEWVSVALSMVAISFSEAVDIGAEASSRKSPRADEACAASPEC